MKFLAFILSIYISALNLVPCTDFDVSDNDVKTEILQAMDNDHQHQGSDLCSPFCICQCCHINATHHQFVYTNIDFRYISTQDFFYHKSLEKEITTSILQPPRA
ncbi:DUF6660 family protein [Tenacibaculum sp. HL-MS23]|uniref:DUF6660 family protein n=1 Tax=Tenacibaculum sp. HL-MS23 TaxID=3077734 RepID=UPI0028FC2D45|nr:DUF6660 family protein [Tenacibaculum sp. HL-MS23]WNW01702.1 DUF6660 family protein [Tenacibaculum sp. HL-MS23]